MMIIPKIMSKYFTVLYLKPRKKIKRHVILAGYAYGMEIAFMYNGLQ
jgi:hypothetical protein